MKKTVQKVLAAGFGGALAMMVFAAPAQASYDVKTYAFPAQQTCLIAEQEYATGSFTRIAQSCYEVAYGYELKIAVRTA